MMYGMLPVQKRKKYKVEEFAIYNLQRSLYCNMVNERVAKMVVAYAVSEYLDRKYDFTASEDSYSVV
jgi:hypothetical protein